MARSYRSRLEEAGEMAEFLKYSRVFGRIATMTIWGFRDDVAVVKIYKEETGDENFGRIPQIGYPHLPDNQDPIEFVLGKAAKTLLNLKAQLETERGLRCEVELKLERVTQYHQQALARGLIKLLEACEA